MLAGERIPLHRAVLAARSSYFHKMLRTAWLPPKVLVCGVVSEIGRRKNGQTFLLCMAEVHHTNALQGGGVREVLLNPSKLSSEALRALIVYLYRC